MEKKQNYFELNLTSYSYMFFTVAMALAYKGYYKLTINSKTFQSMNNIPLAFWQLLSPTLFILLFIVGSFRTFHASSGRWTNILLWALHAFLCFFVVFYSPFA